MLSIRYPIKNLPGHSGPTGRQISGTSYTFHQSPDLLPENIKIRKNIFFAEIENCKDGQ